MRKVKFLLVLAILILALCLVSCKEPAVSSTKTPQVIPDNAKLVWIFFDDCLQNQFDVALPILNQYGFKATFGVITGDIGGGGKDIWKYMDKKELKKIAESGMDIASHSKTHPHLIENLTDQQLQEEIIDSKKYLEEMGFKVRTFVYPYYEWNDQVIAYVKKANYVCARGGWPEEKPFDLNLANSDARYHIPNYQIFDQNFEVFKSIVNQASRYSVVGLTYHFISDTGSKMMFTPVANFAEQMRYLKEAGFTVIILPDIL